MTRRAGVGMAAVVAVAVVAAFAYVAFSISFGDDDNFGPHDLDAKAAASAMQLRRIDIPAGFTFDNMTVFKVFSGADEYSGRYSAPGRIDEAKHAVAEANPDFPALRSATCDDEVLRHDFAAIKGFRCNADTELVVSTRTVDGEDVLTDDYSGTPPDAETVLLTRNGERVELFVLSAGH